MIAAPLQRQPSLREQVYERLRGQLRHGGFGPRDRLTEVGLAAEMGVSRTPVREALGQLSREGLIAPLPNGGFRVPVLDADDLAEVFEVRALLEPHAAGRAAALADTTGLDALEKAIADETAHLADEDVQAFSEANHRFRVALFAMCGNRRLARTIEMYDDHVQFVRLMTLAAPSVRRTVIAGQREIVAALTARDPAAAAQAMDAHLRHARRFLDQALAGQALPDKALPDKAGRTDGSSDTDGKSGEIAGR